MGAASMPSRVLHRVMQRPSVFAALFFCSFVFVLIADADAALPSDYRWDWDAMAAEQEKSEQIGHLKPHSHSSRSAKKSHHTDHKKRFVPSGDKLGRSDKEVSKSRH